MRAFRVIIMGLTLLALGVATATASTAHPGGRAWARWQRHACGLSVAVAPHRAALTLAAQPVTVTYTATVQVQHNGSQPVVLSLSGLPPKVTGTVSPSTLMNPGTVTVTLTAAPDAPTATHLLRLDGRCGHVHASNAFHLTVSAPPPGSPLSVTPHQADVMPGSSVSFCVRSARTPAGALLVSHVPGGVRTSTSMGRHGCVVLVLRVSPRATPGDYTLEVRPAHHRGVPAKIRLRVGTAAAAPTFTISGNLSGQLYPGLSIPLDLTFTNPGSSQLTLSSLQVRIDGVDAAHAAGCQASANYTVRQFTGDPGKVVMPAHDKTSLSASGLPEAQWPQLSMLETDFDQTSCLGATITLRYSGAAG